MNKIILTLGLALFLLTSSRCNEEISCEHRGTVKDLSGLDGCGLIIISDSGDYYEPVELPEGVELKEGQDVIFSFEPVEAMSICMAGEMVKITCLRIEDSDK